MSKTELVELTRDEKLAIVQEDVKSTMEHEISIAVMEEYALNMGIRKNTLEEYGMEKVAGYAAFVASAMAHGFDIDELRNTPEENHKAQMALLRAFADAGKPVIGVVVPGKDKEDA